MMRHFALLLLLICTADLATAQIEEAPERLEGDGPYERLILRGGTIIDGTGAPPRGPVDIVIEGNRIAQIRSVGYPKVPIDSTRRPVAGDRELDVSGMYVMPGFIDMHGHVGGVAQGTPAEYVLKLWMGHGITTIRDPGSGNGAEWMMDHKKKSADNTITAPRIYPYLWFGSGGDIDVSTPEGAREWVRWVKEQGADGIKFGGALPEIFQAALDEANKLGLGTACHHAQLYVSRANVMDTAGWGLRTMEHWYGLPEALFDDRVIQDFRLDYNYNNEQHRFGQAGLLWEQAAERGSEKWNEVIDNLVGLDFTIVPTMTIYEASRDLMKQMRAEWHDEYTLPSLWEFFTPSRKAHGSYWFYWTTEDEVAWKKNYTKWMSFLNDYKNAGGRVATGSDSGYIYKTYGFGYIQELELLREAGFHPLEVIWSATLKGAEAIGIDDEVGSIQVGKLADFAIVDENPLENLKVLYGTGALKLNDDTGAVEKVGGVKYTIKDGIIYDAPALLADVRKIVQDAKDAQD